MTALAATIGNGNIAGVATAITLGGPGAIFWMWVVGLLGMATKYSEALLAMKYRVKNDNGEYSGGPMYYVEKGLGKNGNSLHLHLPCSEHSQLWALETVCNPIPLHRSWMTALELAD